MGEDPLIDYKWGNVMPCFSIMVFVCIAIMVGVLVQKLEDALFFTIVISGVLLFLFIATL